MGWLRIAEMMLYGQDEYKRVRCIYYRGSLAGKPLRTDRCEPILTGQPAPADGIEAND